MVKYYEQTKAKYADDIDHLVTINKNGVWIKETIDKKLLITTAKKLDNNFLLDVTIYKLDDDNSIFQRIESKKVDVTKNNWVFSSAQIYNFNNEKTDVEKKQNYSMYSKYNLEKFNTLYKNLDTISFIKLLTDYKQLKLKGYTKELLDEKLNYFLSLPIFLFLMVVLASIFIIGSVNKNQNIYYVFISIIACVVIYYFKDLSIAMGQTNRISLALAVWMPIIAISLFCLIGVIQINEK
jgi:lipopolysaccharide export LptBFGC system permease protein LptF